MGYDVPGGGAAQGAAGIGALKDAIKFYMDLREGRRQETRQASQDKLAQDRFALDKQQTENTINQSKYKTIADVLDNYGGQTVRGALATDIQNSPYAAALKPHQATLPSFNIDAMGGSFNRTNTPGANEPGAFDIIPSSSEKLRQGAMSINAANARSAAGISSRENIAQMRLRAAADQAATRFGLQRQMVALRARGLDQQAEDIMIRATNAQNAAEQAQWLNQFRALALQHNPNITGARNLQIPSVPDPSYYDPLSGNGLGPWEEFNK